MASKEAVIPQFIIHQALCIDVHSTGRFTWHKPLFRNHPEILSTIRSQPAYTQFDNLGFVYFNFGCIFTCFLYTKWCILSLHKPTRNLQKLLVSSSSVRVTKVFWAFETLTSPKPKKLRSKAPRPGGSPWAARTEGEEESFWSLRRWIFCTLLIWMFPKIGVPPNHPI